MSITIKIILGFVIAIGVAFFALGIFIKTDYAEQVIEQLITDNFTKQMGYDVEINNIDLSFPLVVKLDLFSLSDKAGKLIEIKDFHINVLPSLYSFWEVSVWSAGASELRVNRIPTFEMPLENDKDKPEPFFDPAYVVRSLSIEKIIVGSEITKMDEEIIFDIESYLQIGRKLGHINFNVLSRMISSGVTDLNGATFELLGSYNTDSQNLKIKTAKIRADSIELDGNFMMNNLTDQISGDVKFHSSLLGSIVSEYFEGTTGNLSGQVNFSGTTSKPKINHSIDIILDLSENDYLHLLPISLKGDLLISDGNVDGALNMKQGEIDANAQIGYRNNKIYIKNLKAIAPGFVKEGNITLDPETMLLSGSLYVQDKTLKESSKYLPFLNSGAMEVTVNYSSQDNKTQTLSVKGKLKQFSTKFGDFGHVDVDLNFSDLWNYKLSNSSLAMKSLYFSGVKLRVAKIDAHSQGNSMRVSASAIANQPYPLDIKLTSTISLSEGLDIIIDSFEGKLGKAIIKNPHDIILKLGKQSLVEVKDLKIGEGELNLDGKFNDKGVRMKAILSNIPINAMPEMLQKGFKGANLDGNLSLTGNYNNPVLDIALNVLDISMPRNDEKIMLKNVVSIKGDSAIIKSNVIAQGKNIATMDAKLPTKFTLSPFEFTIKNQPPFSAKVSVAESFNLLSIIPSPSEHFIGGHVKGSLVASGTLAAPLLNGKMRLTYGKYTYKQYGLRLKDVSSDIIASGKKVAFEKISASDRYGNKLSGKGLLYFNQAKDFSFSINTDKFNLLNTPYLQGEVKGDLKVSGNNEQAKAVGSLALGPMEIKIPEHFQDDIPELNISSVIEENNAVVSYTKSDPYHLNLDIEVETTNKVFVRGWGVDTLLEGKLKITGKSHEPLVNGSLKSVRGRYQEFGKLLTVKQGVLTFDGPISPSPYLNIVGVTIEGNTEIRLVLSGSILNPDISIESTPEMEQEDALSLLLFGNDKADNSPFQALQLADGVRRLSGYGGGFDPLGLGRKVLGVDNISFNSEEGDSESTTVGVGKYLTDKVYFELERGGHENSTKTRIEVQISPKISIENVTEQEGNTSLGIKWRFDY